MQTNGASIVATVPTACGIETIYSRQLLRPDLMVATVPTACGIETGMLQGIPHKNY